MNLDRFNDFRDKADIMYKSSTWITNEMNKAAALAEDPSLTIEEQEDLIQRMDNLLNRSQWESEQIYKFREEYKDIIGDM